MSVANQKIIIRGEEQLNPPFTQINNLAMEYAMKDLTYNAFKVYCILARNQPRFKFEYSPTWFQNQGLMSHSSATKARQELENKGYIRNNIFYTRSSKLNEELTEMTTKY